MSELLGKVLLVWDRHKKAEDFKTIKGFCDANSLVSDDILDFVKKESITHVISLGDLYHRGYNEMGAQYADTLDDIMLSDAVNGNYYLVVGNHLFLERDANPEFYLIQPNKYPHLQPSTNRRFKKRVIQVEDELVIGCTQFSFFHYNKENKNYVNRIQDGVKFHIGLYHDDVMIPNSARSQVGLETKVSNDYIINTFSNITAAFGGHVHNKIGKVVITLPSGRKVPLYLQGSLGITSSKLSEYHNSVNMPIIYCYDDKCTIGFSEFSLHTDKLTIYREEDKMPEENKDNVYEAIKNKTKNYKITEAVRQETKGCKTLEEYIYKLGVGNEHYGIYRLASADMLETDKIYDMWRS